MGVGKFVSAYTDSQLADAVREVTLHVASQRPRSVSMAAFDNARASAGIPTVRAQAASVRASTSTGRR